MDYKKSPRDGGCSLSWPSIGPSLPQTTIVHPSTGLKLWSVALGRYTIAPLITPTHTATTGLIMTTTMTAMAQPTPQPLQSSESHPLGPLRGSRRRCNPSIETYPQHGAMHSILSEWTAYHAATRASSNTTTKSFSRHKKTHSIVSEWTAQHLATRASEKSTTLPATFHATRHRTQPGTSPTTEQTKPSATHVVDWSLVPRGSESQDAKPTKSAGELAHGRINWEIAGVCLAGVAIAAFYFG